MTGDRQRIDHILKAIAKTGWTCFEKTLAFSDAIGRIQTP